MTPVSERVVQNAIDCLEILNDDFELDMRLYNSNNYHPVKEENVCRTKFCLAGWQAYKEGYPEEFLNYNGSFDYLYFSRSKLGVAGDYNIWAFSTQVFGLTTKSMLRKE